MLFILHCTHKKSKKPGLKCTCKINISLFPNAVVFIAKLIRIQYVRHLHRQTNLIVIGDIGKIKN